MSARGLAAYAAAPLLSFGLLGAMVATCIGGPAASLVCGLLAVLGACLLVSPPEFPVTEPEAPTLQPGAVPTRGIALPLASGGMLAAGLYGAMLATAAALPVVSLVAGAVSLLGLGTLARGAA